MLDNPDLIVACVIGDGEAETGPLATAWHSNKFLNPVTDGAVLPILHLNGYKIANPTVLARISREELEQLLRGYGWTPLLRRRRRSGDDARADGGRRSIEVIAEIRQIQAAARTGGRPRRPRWPMIVLVTPEGMDRARKSSTVSRIEGTFRAHQVPLSDPALEPGASRDCCKRGCESYRPDELFDARGALRSGARRARAGRRPAHGRESARERRPAVARSALARLPRLRGRRVTAPGAVDAEDTRVLGRFLRDVIVANDDGAQLPDLRAGRNRVESPRCGVRSDQSAMGRRDTVPGDEWLAPDGRVLEMLSEHQCQGWLEGYLLTGRHGLFNTYEAFAHIVDSMFNQHAKWLKVTRGLPWRRPIASLNYLLSSHVWRQDHNGFTHQDPGFIDHAVNKKAEVVRVYLPPDANCLLSVMDHCLRSRHYVNIVVAGKHPAPQWLDDGRGRRALRRGHRHLGVGEQRSTAASPIS